MAVLCWINAIQYSPESVSYPCTSGYYLHTMLSVTCLRLSNVSVICRVTYFQFPIQSAFLSYIGRQAASALRRIGFNTQYRASHVAVNLGTYLSFTQRIVWRKDFELILKVKMETRHLVRVSFGNEFRRSVITAELWRPEVARSGNFVSDFCVFTWQKKTKISAASQTVVIARIAPKIDQGQPPTIFSECCRFQPNRFTFGGVIADCVDTVFFAPYRVFPRFARSYMYASLRAADQ